MPNLPFIIADSAPTPQASPQAFGSAIGSAMEQFGGVVSQVGSQVSEISNRLYAAEQEAVGRRELARTATELADFEYELQSDPDYNSHEKKYQEKVQELGKRETALTGPFSGEYQQRIGEISASGLARVRGKVRERQLDTIRASGIEERQHYTDLAAQASSLEERDYYRGLAAKSLQTEVGIGATHADAAVVEAQKIEKDIFEADIREAITNDPLDAFLRLSNPSGEFKDMPEIERQTWLASAKSAAEANIASAYTKERRADLADRRARRAAQDNAEAELLSIMGPDDVGFITSDDVMSRWEDLGDKADYWMKVAATRGTFPAEVQDNPSIVIAMNEAASTGQDIRPVADFYYAEGLLTKATRDSLVDDASRARFASARSWLAQVAKPQRPMFGALSPAAVQASADATQELERWIRNNPQASADEADKKAREIGQGVAKRVASSAGISSAATVDQRKAEVRADALRRLGADPANPTPEQVRLLGRDEIYKASLREIAAYEAVRGIE